MKTILVATDLSPRSDRAVHRAFRLAGPLVATVHVVYIMDHGLPEALAAKMETEARALLERFCTDAAGAGGAPFTVHIAHGDPAGDIHDLARDTGAGLIVLGSHRPRPFLDIFRETTLERIVRLSSLPVLVVRDPADHPYATLLAALDFAPGSGHAAALAQQLFPGARLHAFHAVHIPFQGLIDEAGHHADAKYYLAATKAERDAWAKERGNRDIAGKTDIVEGSLRQALDLQMSRHKPDLLALGAHGRTGKAPFLLGSFANDMMRDPPCDLLIARP